MKLLSSTQLRLLRQAIDEAEEWRGQIVDASMRADFDARIAKMREALKLVREQQMYIRRQRQLAKARPE